MKKSCPYRAWMNGLVERCNRSIANVAKPIMIQSGLPAEFWAHAVCTAAYTINRLSHRRLPGRITPYEAMFGTRPNVKNLRVFGCHAEILIEKQYRRKDFSQQVSDSAIFIGYCRQSTGFIYHLSIWWSRGAMPPLIGRISPREWGKPRLYVLKL